MRASRVCSTPGCPNLVREGHCPEHARPNAYRRGYDGKHRRTRKAWAERVEAGVVRCWRCRELIRPDEQWDLGHDDVDRSITRGPEHAARCNRSAAGRSAHSE